MSSFDDVQRLNGNLSTEEMMMVMELLNSKGIESPHIVPHDICEVLLEAARWIQLPVTHDNMSDLMDQKADLRERLAEHGPLPERSE